MITLMLIERFEKTMNKGLTFNIIILIWSLSFLSGFAFGETFETQKPVQCTTDEYDEVKLNLNKQYGEVGILRWVTAYGTAVEIMANPDTGSTTILEYLPERKSTCIMSPGKSLELNNKVLQLVPQGTPT